MPIPEPQLSWVRIRVKAFGLNRSELRTRLGLAQGVTFPRVLGIEATCVVADGEVAPKVREIVPTGVEVALELVGTPTLPDTLRATAVHGSSASRAC